MKGFHTFHSGTENAVQFNTGFQAFTWPEIPELFGFNRVNEKGNSGVNSQFLPRSVGGN